MSNSSVTTNTRRGREAKTASGNFEGQPSKSKRPKTKIRQQQQRVPSTQSSSSQSSRKSNAPPPATNEKNSTPLPTPSKSSPNAASSNRHPSTKAHRSSQAQRSKSALRAERKHDAALQLQSIQVDTAPLSESDTDTATSKKSQKPRNPTVKPTADNNNSNNKKQFSRRAAPSTVYAGPNFSSGQVPQFIPVINAPHRPEPTFRPAHAEPVRSAVPHAAVQKQSIDLLHLLLVPSRQFVPSPADNVYHGVMAGELQRAQIQRGLRSVLKIEA